MACLFGCSVEVGVGLELDRREDVKDVRMGDDEIVAER